MSKRYQQGDIINGYVITGEPERNPSGKKVRYPFACTDCEKEIGLQETGNVKRRSPCTCKMGQPDPVCNPRFIKEEEGCSSICHTGVTEYWHKLTNDNGLSQRKAAEHIHSLIMSNTNEGETLEQDYSTEKIRNIARSGTGKKKTEMKVDVTATEPSSNTLTHSSPSHLVEKVKEHREGIDKAITRLREMAQGNQLTSDEPFRLMDNEMSALKAMAERFLQKPQETLL